MVIPDPAFFEWIAEAARYWATPIIAAAIGALIYTRRQRAANRHVLHALWEESRLINHDCLQWMAGFDRDALHFKINADDTYRPYSISYTSSKRAIERLMSDLPGVTPELVRAGLRYHYDDTNASAAIAAIGGDLWAEYTSEQRIFLVDDADRAMRALCVSSRDFHALLSTELKVEQDPDVFERTLPRSVRV